MAPVRISVKNKATGSIRVRIKIIIRFRICSRVRVRARIKDEGFLSCC